MILKFKVKNYRSYKEETVFTMEAGSSEQKSENIADFTLANSQKQRVVKTSVIYGANASGKSNIIRALFEVVNFILNKPKVDEKPRIYNPFIFDVETKEKPSEFELTFINSEIKYLYKFSIQDKKVLEEQLDYYPNGKVTRIFTREVFDDSKRIQKGFLGDSFKNKEISVFENQLILSKFGDDEPHELLTEVFLYFKNYNVINATNEKHKDYLLGKVSGELFKNNDLKGRVGKLIKAVDTKVNDIDIVRVDDENLNDETKALIEKNPFLVFGNHDMYNKNKFIGTDSLPLMEESTGTQSLYVLGGEILSTIEKGGVLIVDELDTSLHPFITKMIVMIFQSKTINNKNAQLVFTTHDVTLLDKDLIRRDQIWIAEKDNKGSTDLYSLQDFDGLREDIPFEKWYLAGKFGGLPKIKSIESLFSENEPVS
ncbi:ATP-binding protein [Flavobacterium sp.]|uniref:AAA family ATPase n=1 Tax=Flavobacterium sp. TaxID=239 RepID=UPI00286DE319|nr:ATP-binding protein [Flavobacterium sp.]